MFGSVASYKSLTVNEVFPHSVQLLAPLIDLASQVSFIGWESQFVIYLWLSVVILAPFEFEALGLDPQTTNERIYNLCIDGIESAPNPSVRKSASILLARFLARQNNNLLPKLLSGSPNISALNQVLKIVPSLSIHLELLWSILSLPKNPTKHHLSVASSIAVLQLNSNSGCFVKRIENLLNQILQLCVGNPSITVRESAAKAIGRICSHLGPEHTNQFLEYLLNGGKDTTDEFELHSIFLIFGEICRRKNGISFFEFPSHDLINLIINGIEKERKNASFIRDSACALVWSIARSVGGFGRAESLVTSLFLPQIIPSLLTLSLFDRDVNMRRTGAAALQELIGRVGTKLFPSGLKILDLIDFWTISNIKDSFKSIPKQLVNVLEFCPIIDNSELCDKFLNHLWEEQVFHETSKIDWNAFSLAADAFSVLFTHHDISEKIKSVCDIILDDSNPYRRVAAMGLLNSIMGNESVRVISDETTKTVIRNIIPQIEKRRLFREKLGDKMRIFCYLFLGKLFYLFSNFDFKNETKFIEKVLEIIHDGIVHLLPEVSRAAVGAITQLAVVRPPTVVPLLESYIDQLESTKVETNLCARRGMLSALVAIAPTNLAQGTIQLCINESLSWPTHFTGNRNHVDPECRRIAVLYFLKQDSQKIKETLFACLEDFQTDKRGDVGSWVREAAIEILIAKGCGDSVAVLAHKLERLDRVREAVSNQISPEEIFRKYQIPRIANDVYTQIYVPTTPAHPEQTLIHLLSSPHLSPTDLDSFCSQLIVCVGSQTPCVISNAIEKSLIDFCESYDSSGLLNILTTFIVTARNSTGRFSGKVDRVNRILIPSINTLCLLFQTVERTKVKTDLNRIVDSIDHHISSSKLPSILEVALLRSVSKFLSRIVCLNGKYMEVFLSKIMMSQVPLIRAAGATDWIKALVLRGETEDTRILDILESTTWLSEEKVDWIGSVKNLVEISGFEWDGSFDNDRLDNKVAPKSQLCDYAQFIQEEYRLS